MRIWGSIVTMVTRPLCAAQLELRPLILADRGWVPRSSGGYIDVVNNILFPISWGKPGYRISVARTTRNYIVSEHQNPY